jgi:hypothetical protein
MIKSKKLISIDYKGVIGETDPYETSVIHRPRQPIHLLM